MGVVDEKKVKKAPSRPFLLPTGKLQTKKLWSSLHSLSWTAPKPAALSDVTEAAPLWSTLRDEDMHSSLSIFSIRPSTPSVFFSQLIHLQHQMVRQEPNPRSLSFLDRYPMPTPER